MLTIYLQLGAAAVSLLFGVLAWRVGMQGPEAFSRPPHRTAWWLTGVAFAAIGISSVTQAVAAAVAYLAGPGSWTWSTYLRWMQAGTYGRVGLVLGFSAALIALAMRERGGVPFRRACSGVLAVALLTGSVAGAMKGAVTGRGGAYFSGFALANSVEMVLLLLALVATLVRSTVGWYLWACLVIYAVVLTLNVSWYSALAWVDIPGSWRPPPGSSQVYTIAAYGMMSVLAARRLWLARRQEEVRALLEPLRGEMGAERRVRRAE